VNEIDIFLAALEQGDAAVRSAYLDEVCVGNPALRRSVESLLRSHEGAGKFLETPALQQVAEAMEKEPLPEETEATWRAFLDPSDQPGVLGKLGPYEVREVIGRGGMGLVLKAFDPSLARLVAVKMLAPQLAANATARKRFAREARAAAAVRHENVVAIYAVEEARGLPYFVMEYIAGTALQERLDQAGPLPVADTVRIGMQMASGLAAAHAQGLVHRDIKPANILLEDIGRLKISDFGLARTVDDVSLTQSGVVAGTPEYMAPEQARGEAVDHRADLFSLGSVLYALSTGRPPFRASSTMAVLRLVGEEKPRPVRELNPDIPAWLAEIIDKLQARDPAGRFQSAAEVADLLGRRLAELQRPPLQAPQARAPVQPPPAAQKPDWLGDVESDAGLPYHKAELPMPYSAEISRTNPSCFLFLVDRSLSMDGPFGGQPGKKKSEGVADALNRLLQNLVLKCAKSDGVRDYFHVGVIGYGGQVGPALAGPLAGQALVPVSTLANHPLRIEQRARKVDDGAGGLVEQAFKFPVWLEPVANGKTPMCQALTLAGQLAKEFIGRFPACYPPIVVNISDGKATDGDPLGSAADLRGLQTSDGNVLLFNLHLSSSPASRVEFPGGEDGLADAYARLLFRMSSVLPPSLTEAAEGEGYHLEGEPRGFVFNADLVAVIRFLDIGTRVSQTVR
jgi:serine/threonine protein kinase